MQQLDIETFYNQKELKRFYCPAKILWGHNCREELFGLISDKDTAEVYIDSFFVRHPFAIKLKFFLGNQCKVWKEIDATPKVQDIESLCRDHPTRADLIIAIGGGSTADFAKCVIAMSLYGTFEGVGVGSKRGIKIMDDVRKPRFVALPTTAGTGAEVSRYYVSYDAVTHAKMHGKSWKLIADWVLIDPEFICSTPDALLAASAFDAFIHYFESLICQSEASWCGETFSVDGIFHLVSALDGIVHQRHKTAENYLELAYAATFAGVAISNVRTGNIHEAAGALLERTSMTHAETLFVFLTTAYGQYRSSIKHKEKRIMARLEELAPKIILSDFSDLMMWWEKIFESVGLLNKIQNEMRGLPADLKEIKAHIFERVWSDRVWCDKESPIKLTELLVHDLIDQSFAKFRA